MGKNIYDKKSTPVGMEATEKQPIFHLEQ